MQALAPLLSMGGIQGIVARSVELKESMKLAAQAQREAEDTITNEGQLAEFDAKLTE
jgi:hypothetical protein